MHELTGFQRDLLIVIAGRDHPHGLALKADIEDYYETGIHHGRLYPNLDTLVDRGFVDKSEKDLRTNAYRVSDEDVVALAARRTWTSDRYEP